MKESFPAALAATLQYEGGYSNHPKDPGGATMRGVTQRVYDAWRRTAGSSLARSRPSPTRSSPNSTASNIGRQSAATTSRPA
jgi:hypothetical protein